MDSKILRYGMILIPAFVSMYTAADIADLDRFVLETLALLLTAVLGARLSGSLTVLAACLELCLSSLLCWKYGDLMIFPSLSAMLCYMRLQPAYVPFLLTAVHGGLLLAGYHHTDPGMLPYALFTFMLAALLTFLLRRSGNSREETLLLYDELRKRHFELDEARSRLQQFAVQVEQAAQSEERVRISRQLHDDVGHRLIRVKMMMEAAIHTLPSSTEAGLRLMEQIRDQLAASMDEMRSAVRRIGGATRTDSAYTLDKLLEETGRDTGVITSYRIHGTPFPLYPSLQIVLYKNAREAVTNALRHGGASEIWIELSYSDTELVMEVGNNGQVPGSAREGAAAGGSKAGSTAKTDPGAESATAGGYKTGNTADADSRAESAAAGGPARKVGPAASVRSPKIPAKPELPAETRPLLHQSGAVLPSIGVGIRGMQERTALVGGTLELRMAPYFAVITRLPVYKQSEVN
ncbi:sensor histidine kinase [Paenibacillus sp. CN-4]|uniref:sensor histidine kinase n=1 Tax=Paenibacillus nanchangensis TaxID=3348343 RepID=UPI00397B5FB8